MPDTKARNESMLFNYETTYRTDFRDTEPSRRTKTQYKPKPTCLRVRPPPLKDIHTFTDWKSRAPFSLLHRRKAIVGTNPREVQEAYSQPHDTDRERAQQTRPRLTMTPAISVDDIQDPAVRDILVKDMYTSDMTRATKDAIAEYSSVKSPLPGHPAPANPIFLPQLQPPYVDPEWRMESVTWDRKQLRAYCDPDKKFWTARPPTSLDCKSTAKCLDAVFVQFCQLHKDCIQPNCHFSSGLQSICLHPKATCCELHDRF